MDQAFAFIGRIADWLGQWIPRWQILDPTQGAIKYVGGKRIVECKAGIHFWWPARTTFQEYPTARQTDRLEMQTMESKDGKTYMYNPGSENKKNTFINRIKFLQGENAPPKKK